MVMRYNHQIGDVGALVISIGIYLANSSGRLRLQSRDINTQPYLDYNMLGTDSDLKRMRGGVRMADRIAASPKFANHIGERLVPDESTIYDDNLLNKWMLQNVQTMHHISGTCKMGPAEDHGAVVDQFGKVHGVEGLRIADVSIVPDCPRANTNVIAMTIGERIADFVNQNK